MTNSILSKIQHDSVVNLSLYRLGVFGNTSFELIELLKDVDYQPHKHMDSEVVFNIVLGEGRIIIGDQKLNYKLGDQFQISPGTAHGFHPKKPTLILALQTPPIRNPKTGKEDIEF